MAIVESTTHVRDWLQRRRKDELVYIILANLSRIDLFADKPYENKKELPLRVQVKDDHLCIAIGIDTLAFAFENSDWNNPYDEDFVDSKRTFSVCNKAQFAEDVCRELNREGEDGSTPFTRLLDDMLSEAADQGSLGIKEARDAD